MKYLLLFLTVPLFAVTLSIQTGKEGGQPFSYLHIKNNVAFSCQEFRNDFKELIRVECRFNKSSDSIFQPFSNNFFKVETRKTRKEFFVVVTPKYKMKLSAINVSLTSKEELNTKPVKQAKHWIVSGFKEKHPFIKKDAIPVQGLNFPVSFNGYETPFIGTLDIAGKPIFYDKTQDVSAFLKIKNLYNRNKLDEVLEEVDEFLQKNKQTLFKSEMLLYKIRALNKKQEYSQLLDIAKDYIRVYSANENLPEVLLYMSRAYAKLGMVIDAKYFFDRLLTEHAKNEYSNLGYIYLGDMVLNAGDSAKAIEYYRKALYSTKNLEYASIAAERLAKYYLEQNKLKDSVFYMAKILEANPDFMFERLGKYYGFAKEYAEKKEYAMPARITGYLLTKMKKLHDDYEEMLKNNGIWLDDAGKHDEAYKVYKTYLSEFQFGNYEEEIQKRVDNVFFGMQDVNTSKKLENFDELIKKYDGDKIASKALFEKAKVYLEEKQYDDVMALRDNLYLIDEEEFPKAKELVQDAATALTLQRLKAKQCKGALDYVSDYNLTIPSHEKQIFDCAMANAKYDLAQNISQKFLKSNDLKERLYWLYNYTKILYKLNDYKGTVLAAEEVIELANLEKEKQYKEVLREKFFAHKRLGQRDEMFLTAKELESSFGKRYTDMDIYLDVLKLGKRKKDYVLVQNYATKIIELQEANNIFTNTPFVEFELINAYRNQGKIKPALDVANSLVKKELSAFDKARAYYELGSLYQSYGDREEARIAYEASVNADADSAWGKLSVDSLELLE